MLRVKGTRLRILVALAGYLVVTVVLSAAAAWFLPYGRGWDVAFGASLFALSIGALRLGVIQARNPQRPTIDLDDDGFAMTYRNHVRRFAWKDVGPFVVGHYRIGKEQGDAVYFDFDTPDHSGPNRVMRRVPATASSSRVELLANVVDRDDHSLGHLLVDGVCTANDDEVLAASAPLGEAGLEACPGLAHAAREAASRAERNNRHVRQCRGRSRLPNLSGRFVGHAALGPEHASLRPLRVARHVRV
jgi:hypothetical protein